MDLVNKVIRYYHSKRFSNEAIIKRLRERGVTIGEGVHIYSIDGIDAQYGPLITIGDNVTISTKVTILAHDASTKKHIGYTKISKINIGNKCFIGSGSIILPGTSIGDNCIVGAGTVVRGDVPDNSVLIGNPARVICSTEYYVNKYKGMIEDSKGIYDDNSLEDLFRAAKELEGMSVGFVL